MKTLLIAGGSGGHLIPALALAEHLQSFGPCQILSTARPIDRIVADSSAIEWTTVDLKQFTPLWRWALPWYTARQFGAMIRIWSIVRRSQPEVVIGFGGYLSAVGVASAKAAGFPSVVHEQNLLPGRANRLLARLADAVAVSFPETKQFLPSQAVVEITGNPIRSELRKISGEEARKFFGFDMERPVLLVMGGSQGARAINALSVAMWENQPPERRKKIQVIHLTGAVEAVEMQEKYRRLGIEARVYPFLREIPYALSAATLAISRAGATSICEMVELQLPALLIPYPHAGGHQQANARWMALSGGAVVLKQERLTAENLWKEVDQLLWVPDRLQKMRDSLRARANGSAVERLGSLVRRMGA